MTEEKDDDTLYIIEGQHLLIARQRLAAQRKRAYYRGTPKEELTVFIIFICVLFPVEWGVFRLLGI